MAKAKKKSRAQEGPGAGRRRPGLRGALHGKKDQEVGRCGEEGGQESGLQPEACQAPARTLGTGTDAIMKVLRCNADLLDRLSRDVGRLADVSLCDFDDFLGEKFSQGITPVNN